MTLPSTGPISLSQVAVELGRAANATVSLGETAVANLSHGNQVGPFGPTVSMSSLYGKSAGALVTVSLSSNAATIGNKIQTASMSFNTDGTCSLTSLVDGSTSWWNQVQAGIGSSYWVKIVYNSQINTVSSGATFGTWYHLSSAVTYTIKNSASTTEASGSASIYFSTAGTDATIVGATGSWSWDLGSAH